MAKQALYLQVYWTGDLLGHLFILLLIIGLIQRTQKKPPATWALTGCAVVVALVSAYMSYSPYLTRWMTPVSRNMSLLEEGLDFLLWAAILQKGANDYLHGHHPRHPAD